MQNAVRRNDQKVKNVTRVEFVLTFVKTGQWESFIHNVVTWYYDSFDSLVIMNGSRLIVGCFRFIFGSRYAYSRINTVGATFKWNHLNCTKMYMSGHSKFPKTKWKYWTVPCEQCGRSNFAASQKFETMNTFLVSIPMFNRPQQEVSELFQPKWRQPLLFLHCTLYFLTGKCKKQYCKRYKNKKNSLPTIKDAFLLLVVP